MPSPARLFKKFCAAGTNGHLDFSFSWQAYEDPPKKIIQDKGPEIRGKPKRESLLEVKTQLYECLKIRVNGRLG